MSTSPLDIAALGIEVVVLLGLSCTLLYAVVRYGGRVLYPTGVLLLATSLLLFTLGAVLDFSYWANPTGRVEWLVAAYFVYTVASLTTTGSMWVFAREFVGTRDGEHLTAMADSYDGGFEDAP